MFAKTMSIHRCRVSAVTVCYCVASALILQAGCSPAAPDQEDIRLAVQDYNKRFPRPLSIWGTWQRIDYSDGVLSARFEVNRSTIDDLDWDKARARFVKIICTAWKDDFKWKEWFSLVRKFEASFYSGTTLFHRISITHAACSAVASS